MAKRPYPIDRNMVKLVDALNRIPGVRTFSCCGGHKNPRGSQVPAGEFTVSIEVSFSAKGWAALATLQMAIYEVDCERMHLGIWMSGDVPETLSFDVAGFDGADPDALAAELARVLDLRRVKLRKPGRPKKGLG